MNIFGFLKRKPKGCQLRHYKEAGYSYPENMIGVIRFDSKIDKWGYLAYSVRECSGCGVRAFCCPYAFIQSATITKAVDDFIGHKIDMEALIAEFQKVNFHYEIIKEEIKLTIF